MWLFNSRLLYPTSNPPYMRKIGVDLNLQERLDEMFAKEQSEEVTNAVDIGFPVGKLSKYIHISILLL